MKDVIKDAQVGEFVQQIALYHDTHTIDDKQNQNQISTQKVQRSVLLQNKIQ